MCPKCLKCLPLQITFRKNPRDKAILPTSDWLNLQVHPWKTLITHPVTSRCTDLPYTAPLHHYTTWPRLARPQNKSQFCLDALCTAAMLHVIKNCQDQLLLLLLLHPHYYYYYLCICLLAEFQGQIFFFFFLKGEKYPQFPLYFLSELQQMQSNTHNAALKYYLVEIIMLERRWSKCVIFFFLCC